MAMSRSIGGNSLTTVSPISTCPELIASNPAIMRSVVVLPQPDGPTSTTNSRSWISRRSEEHTAELQSLMRNSYASFCLHNKNQDNHYKIANLTNKQT